MMLHAGDRVSHFLLEYSFIMPLAVSIMIAATTITCFIIIPARRSKKDDVDDGKNKKKGKLISFTSAAIAMGSFPESTNMLNPMIQILISFNTISDCPEEDDVVSLVDKLLVVDRMGGIPRGDVGSHNWHFERCSNINSSNMVRTFDVSCDNLEAMACEIQKLSENFDLRSNDRNLPWWEFCLLRNKGKCESMLVLRFDHAIGDGMSLGRIFSLIISYSDGTHSNDFIPASMRLRKSDTTKRLCSSIRMMCNIIPAFLKVSYLPMSRCDHKIAFLKNSIGTNVATHNRKIVIFDNIPLAYVKEIKNSASVTVNDILTTALSQAIHHLCKDSDCQVLKKYGRKVRCRSLMTFGFPSDQNADINDAVENTWVVLSLNLGVGISNLRERLQYIKEQTVELKESLQVRFLI